MIRELEFCKICNQPFELSHPWRKHRIKLETYCLQHFDRRDLLDGTPLPFKSPEQYFGSLFSNKNNLKVYLKGLSKERAADFCKQLLIKRKEIKELVYAPFQVELASLSCFPPVHYLLSLFDYYDFCDSIGLINKVRHVGSFNLSLNSFGGTVTIDSRESNPLKFNSGIEVKKLEVGDYSFSNNPSLVFERKSLQDLIGTLTQGLDRFIKELERAQSLGIYLVMIVESKLSDALSFNYLPWMKRVKTKATPDFIFYNLRDLIQRFPNFQPLFVDGRKECSDYIMKGFLSGDTYKQYDLQLLYQMKLF